MAFDPVPWSKLEELAALLRNAREKLGLTQEQVAAAVDVDDAIYRRIEKGTMMPTTATFKRVCRRLRLDYTAVVIQLASEDEVPVVGEDESPLG